MNNRHFFIFLICVIVLFESVAMHNINESKKRNSLLFFLLALASYGIVCLLLHKCYDFGGMSVTNFTWYLLSIISVLLIGYIGFDEKITLNDITGLILCIIGLYYIFIKDH
jgi:drug/metabolite transporter (DMT)-like permease